MNAALEVLACLFGLYGVEVAYPAPRAAVVTEASTGRSVTLAVDSRYYERRRWDGRRVWGVVPAATVAYRGRGSRQRHTPDWSVWVDRAGGIGVQAFAPDTEGGSWRAIVWPPGAAH